MTFLVLLWLNEPPKDIAAAAANVCRVRLFCTPFLTRTGCVFLLLEGTSLFLLLSLVCVAHVEKDFSLARCVSYR